MALQKTGSALILASAFAAGVTNGARAETFCEAVVKSGWASGKTEAEAKNAATTWWSSRAGSLGAGYEVWERAKDKSLSCHTGGPSGTVKCIASAKPCLPEGKLPNDPNKRDL